MKKKEPLQYCILNPTGNITALVESDVEIPRQTAAAAALMKKHPRVEQVGFIRFVKEEDEETAGGIRGIQVQLRMAGGEFCGNASMSAAALYLARTNRGAILCHDREEKNEPDDQAKPPVIVRLQVSGCPEPVEVRLESQMKGACRTGIRMPEARRIDEREFTAGSLRGKLPVVHMEGISHIIVEPDSVFFSLLQNRETAEQAIQSWCHALKADGLGLMFAAYGARQSDEDEGAGVKTPCSPHGSAGMNSIQLTPLVYIPGGETVFWENSCASGSSAAGMYLAKKTGKSVDLVMKQPGGNLHVKSDPAKRETWLYGKVSLEEQCIL